MICIFFSEIPSAQALEALEDGELGAVTGSGIVDFSRDGNAMRIFLDMQLEIYAEIDSLKLGYYERQNLTTRKALDPLDPKIYDGAYTGVIPLDEIPADPFVVAEIAHKYEGKNPPEGPGLYYVDSDEQQFKYKEVMGLIKGYLAGPQMGNSMPDLKAPPVNPNTMDWDINWENLRLGKSEAEPFKINGLIVRLEFDESKERLTDLVIGSNDFQGDFYADMIRTTGYLNPKLPHQARTGSHQDKDMASEFNGTPVPISMIRDSFLWWVDHYKFQEVQMKDHMIDGDSAKRETVEHLYDHWQDHKVDGVAYYQGQELREENFLWKDSQLSGMRFKAKDPASSEDHSAMFLRVGLDPTSPTFGVSAVAGYEESVAANFQFSGKNITEFMKEDWWDQPY